MCILCVHVFFSARDFWRRKKQRLFNIPSVALLTWTNKIYVFFVKCLTLRAFPRWQDSVGLWGGEPSMRIKAVGKGMAFLWLSSLSPTLLDSYQAWSMHPSLPLFTYKCNIPSLLTNTSIIVCSLVSAFPFVAGVASSPLNGGSMIQWEERVLAFCCLSLWNLYSLVFSDYHFLL